MKLFIQLANMLLWVVLIFAESNDGHFSPKQTFFIRNYRCDNYKYIFFITTGTQCLVPYEHNNVLHWLNLVNKTLKVILYSYLILKKMNERITDS